MDRSSKSETIKHSKIAFNKWKPLWEHNALKNKDKIVTSHKDVLGIYKDKKIILFSFGPSFKQNVEEFRIKYMNDPDVVVGCVDKAFRALTLEGIQPQFCLMADGSVNIEYLKGCNTDYIKGCYFICSVYGNPEWSDFWLQHSCKENLLWYLNKDNIDTQSYFANISGYYEQIEAASNVGNSLVVFSVKIFGGKNIVLYGYDYSWTDGKYYGDSNHKKSFMLGTNRMIDINGDIIYTSDNMAFSASWLEKYVSYTKYHWDVNIVNRTGRGILNIRRS